MIAGCSMSDSTPPSDSAQAKRRTDLSTVRAAGSPPRTTQVSMPPKPRICLAASECCGCSGKPGHVTFSIFE